MTPPESPEAHAFYSTLDTADRELWQERAGIREHDGRQTRADAEAGACEDLEAIRIARRLRR